MSAAGYFFVTSAPFLLFVFGQLLSGTGIPLSPIVDESCEPDPTPKCQNELKECRAQFLADCSDYNVNRTVPDNTFCSQACLYLKCYNDSLSLLRDCPSFVSCAAKHVVDMVNNFNYCQESKLLDCGRCRQYPIDLNDCDDI